MFVSCIFVRRYAAEADNLTTTYYYCNCGGVAWLQQVESAMLTSVVVGSFFLLFPSATCFLVAAVASSVSDDSAAVIAPVDFAAAIAAVDLLAGVSTTAAVGGGPLPTQYL